MAEVNAGQSFVLLQEEFDLLVEECGEKLDEVEQDLMDVVEARADKSPDFINRVFRAFHSVKGAADFMGNDPLKKLSHVAENVLGSIREGKIELTIPHAETLLSAVALLKQMAADPALAVTVDFSREAGDLDRILSTCHNGDAPASPSPEQLPSLAADSRARPAAVKSSPSLRILLVEDDFTSRVMLQGLLRAYGQCDVAVNGKEAVEAFRATFHSPERYDLICMDVRMPEMDGTEAVRQIRAIEEGQRVYSTDGVRIFMTTAIRDLKTIHSSYRALCDAYLFKPISGAQLKEHLLAFSLVQAPVPSHS